MHFSAHKLTATTLVAFLATLGCFEHLFHDVTHRPAHHSVSNAHGCCFHQTEQDACSNEESPTNQHDPETCAMCRHLALPQLVDPAPQVFFTSILTSGVVVADLPSVTCPSVKLVPIRGPPLSELAQTTVCHEVA